MRLYLWYSSELDRAAMKLELYELPLLRAIFSAKVDNTIPTTIYLHVISYMYWKLTVIQHRTKALYGYIHIKGVPGGMDKTSGECSLC